MGDYGNTKVIQITNIAPQATRDQMHTLFNNLGKIEDLRLYPSIRDASVQIQSRCCFLKFIESSTLPLALHMSNTVFIDRAIVVQPFVNGDLPDEWSGLEFANSSTTKGNSTLPSHVVNSTEDDQLVTTDPNLEDSGLPSFPNLPAGTDEKVIEEIRRTISVIDIDPELKAEAVIEYFGTSAGEVKYFRWVQKEGDDRKIALVEFSDYGAIIPAMRLNDTVLGERTIKVFYSTRAITKPQAKSNEAAQREIEEAMKKVKEAQNLVTDAVNPLKEWLGVRGRITRSRTRSPSRYRDSYRRSRSRSRDRRRSRDLFSSRRRSRSRRRRSRSRSRRRSRSRKRSRSRRRSRSRSKDRKRDKKSDDSDAKVKEDPDKNDEGKSEENGVKKEVKEEPEENGKEEKAVKKKSRSRSKSRDRKRSRSRDRKRSRSRDRRRSRSRSRKRGSRRSRSRDRKKRSRSRRRSRSRSRDKKSKRSRSRSRDHKSKKSKKSKKGSEERERDSKKDKISRDYDAEEAGFESTNGRDEKGPADMEISNSP